MISTESCVEAAGRDEAAALWLKTFAVAAILAASAAGVAVPLAGRERWLGSGGGGTFALIKAFSAGVVLATGFVHVLGDAEKALTDPCLPAAPWKAFPFAGFVALLSALGTLAVDVVCTQLYEGKLHRGQQREEADASEQQHEAAAPLLRDSAVAEITVERRWDGTDDVMDVAGTSAQVSAQWGSHGHGHDHGQVQSHGHDEEPSLARRVVVAQVCSVHAISIILT